MKTPKSKIRKLFDSQLNAVLATSKKDKPYCCLVSFLVTNDLRYLIFATKRDRLKYRHIVANHSVALLIDNTTNQPDDFNEAMSVTLQGMAEDIKGVKKNKYADILAKRHPKLKNFINSEDTAVIRVAIEKIYIITNFESVEILNISQD